MLLSWNNIFQWNYTLFFTKWLSVVNNHVWQTKLDCIRYSSECNRIKWNGSCCGDKKGPNYDKRGHVRTSMAQTSLFVRIKYSSMRVYGIKTNGPVTEKMGHYFKSMRTAMDQISMRRCKVWLIKCFHNENTPIQVYRKFHLQKLKISR